MKKQTVVIVGAGSTHTPGIIQSLLQKKNEFPLRKLVLYDIDSKRMHLVYDIMKQFIYQEYPELEVIVTTDKEKAYTDIDFVFAQIRQGGLSMRSTDEKIPLKYDVVGQETCRPGGSISYGIRSITGVVELIKDARRYSPKCWILNYSNPAAVVAEATSREFNNERILNICDMPTAILLSFTKMLGLKNWQELNPCYFGLNHFGWFTELYDKDGVDRLPELREMILEKGMAVSDKHHQDPDWNKTWKQYVEIVKDYPKFLPNSYLQYYLYSKEMAQHMDQNWTRADMVIN